VNFCEINFISS
jgi:hypothetical protein